MYDLRLMCVHRLLSIINVATILLIHYTLRSVNCFWKTRTLADPDSRRGRGLQRFRVRVWVGHQNKINNSQLVFVKVLDLNMCVLLVAII